MKHGLLKILLIVGILIPAIGQAKKYTPKDRLLTVEQLSQIIEDQDCEDVLFLVNGNLATLAVAKQIPAEWIVFVESFSLSSAKFVPSSWQGRVQDRWINGVINIGVVRPKTSGDYSGDYEPRFPLQYSNGIDNWVRAKMRRYTYSAVRKTKVMSAMVYFTVESDGTLSSFDYDRSLDKELAEDLIKILNKSPRWVPAVRNSVAVRRECVLRYHLTVLSADGSGKLLLLIPDISVGEGDSEKFILPQITETRMHYVG